MRFPEIAVRSRRLKTQPGHHGSSGTLRHGPSGRTEFTPFTNPKQPRPVLSFVLAAIASNMASPDSIAP
jgi:hypothetical protein